MIYEVYSLGTDATEEPFDRVHNYKLFIGDGVYRFYKKHYSEPSVVYPINAFWILEVEE